MNKLACVACDLDGSLLNSKKRISPRDKATIAALKAKGVHFFIATGRPAQFAKQVVSEVGFDYPACCSNGANIYDYSREEPLFSVEPIPKAQIAAIMEFLRQRQASFLLYTARMVLFDRPDSKRTLFWKDQVGSFEPQNRFEFRYVTDPDVDISKLDIIKILAPYVSEEFKQEFEERFNREHRYEVVWSEKEVLDINTAGTNKGFGLRTLARLFDFDLKDAMVLGDNFNDLSMLEVCGWPVAPQNAEENLKAMARYITTDNDHDPLTNAVRALFPQYLED